MDFIQLQQNQELSLHQLQFQEQGQFADSGQRYPVKDTGKHPYCGIGKVISRFFINTQNRWTEACGTGAIIRKNMILTSAHVLMSQDKKTLAHQIYFIPEQNFRSNRLEPERIRVLKCYLEEPYLKNSQREEKNALSYDYVVLTLEDNDTIKQSQILKFSPAYTPDILKTHEILISGYGGSEKQANTQLQSSQLAMGQMQIQGNMLIGYKHWTENGNSGGPLLLETTLNTFDIVGIHKGRRANFNIGLQLGCLSKVVEAVKAQKTEYMLEKSMYCYEPSMNSEVQLKVCKKQLKKAQKNLRNRETVLKKTLQSSIVNENKLKKEQHKIKQFQKQLQTKRNLIKDQQKTIKEQSQQIENLLKTNNKISTKNQQLNLLNNTFSEELSKLRDQLQTRKQKQMEYKLYEHFERHIKVLKNDEVSGWSSFWFSWMQKQLQRDKIVNKIAECQQQFQRLKPLSPQLSDQILFLLDYFNQNNRFITKKYFIDSDYEHSTNPVMFFLNFDYIKQRMGMKQFLSFNNWNHLVELSFDSCGWFDDDDWRALVQHADNFNNLKRLDLNGNQVNVIREGDIDKFKSLKKIVLRKLLINGIDRNLLRGQSKEVLNRLSEKNHKMTISYDK